MGISELEIVSRELVLVEGQEFGGVFIYGVVFVFSSRMIKCPAYLFGT